MASIVDHLLLVAETIPVIGALITLVYAAWSMPRIQPKFRWIVALSTFAMFILVLAQTSWAVAFLVYASTAGTWWSDRMWSIFNTTVTVIGFLTVQLALKESQPEA